MNRALVALAVFFFAFVSLVSVVSAQTAVPPTHRYYRLICLVHLKGTGRAGDSVVPEFVEEGLAEARAVPERGAERAAKALAPARPGILAWKMLPSDDGSMAIIQVVAADHRAFDAIRSDKRSEIRVFEIGQDRKENIEAELRKYRRDFDLDSFQVVVQ